MNASVRASVGQVAVDFDQNRDVGYWPEVAVTAAQRSSRYRVTSGRRAYIENVWRMTPSRSSADVLSWRTGPGLDSNGPGTLSS